MMALPISRQEALDNLMRLKTTLIASPVPKTEKKRRVYRALLNRRTGALRLVQKIGTLRDHLPPKGDALHPLGEWREVSLVLEGDRKQFSLFGETEERVGRRELSGLAWRVLSETLDVLNGWGDDSPAVPFDEGLKRRLDAVEVVRQGPSIETLPEWRGECSREEAEKALEGKKGGSYLLREADRVTIATGFHCAEAIRGFVHPYLVTFVAPGDRISEKLLLQTRQGWTLYRDDPDLSQPFYHYFPSARELLSSIEELRYTTRS